jgi:translation initiation factor IF-3
MFRGREQAHPERGEALLRKLAAELQELATIEQEPNQEGRNMTMMLAPVKGAVNSKPPQDESAAAEAPAEPAPAEAAPPEAETAQAPADPAPDSPPPPAPAQPAEAPAEESAA